MIAEMLSLAIGDTPLLSFRDRGILWFPEVLTLIVLLTAVWRPGMKELWKRVVRIPHGYWIGLALLCIGGCVGVVTADLSLAGLAAYKAWIVMPALLGLLVVLLPKIRNYLGWYVSVVLVAQVVYGVVIQASAADGFGRVTGTFSSPNYLAMLLVPVIAWQVLRFIETHVRWQRMLSAFVIGVLVVGVILTASLGGYLALGSLLIFLAWHYRHRTWARILGGGVALLTLIFLAEAFSRFGSPGPNSLMSRLEIWNVAFHLGADQPLTGIGLRTFAERYRDIAVAVLGYTPIEWMVPQPHNLYLAYWLNLGVVGLMGLAAWLQLIRWQHIGVLIVLPVLVHGLLDTPAFAPAVAWVIPVVFAYLISFQYRGTNE
jgi:O-antigen ligase